MIDKDLTNVDLISELFLGVFILYCVFHVIKYLKSLVANEVISNERKNIIMSNIKKMVWAKSEEINTKEYEEFKKNAKGKKSTG